MTQKIKKNAIFEFLRTISDTKFEKVDNFDENDMLVNFDCAKVKIRVKIRYRKINKRRIRKIFVKICK